MNWIGVDLHSDNFQICRLSEDGSTSFDSYDLSAKSMKRFRLSLSADDRIAVETTGNSAWFWEQFRDSVSGIVVVDTRRFEVDRRSTSKTDRNDSKLLAEYLSVGKLPGTRIKSRVADDLAVLASSRILFVKQRTVLINRIKSLYRARGMRLAGVNLTTRKQLLALDLSHFTETKRFQIELFCDQILHLNEVISIMTSRIVEVASGVKGFEGLTSISGIGPFSAAVFLSVIGDINDFASEKKLASYFGLVPRVRQSNQSVWHGRITRHGSSLARATLVQCTLVSIRHSPYLREHYERIKARRGTGKAIIATSRKLLGIIYNTLKNDWVFEDFAEFRRRSDCSQT